MIAGCVPAVAIAVLATWGHLVNTIKVIMPEAIRDNHDTTLTLGLLLRYNFNTYLHQLQVCDPSPARGTPPPSAHSGKLPRCPWPFLDSSLLQKKKKISIMVKPGRVK